MSKANNMMIAEALDSLQSGLIDFLNPKLSLPEPAINPAFLPIYKKRIKEGAKPALDILDLASLIKIITWNWKKYYTDLGYDAKNGLTKADRSGHGKAG